MALEFVQFLIEIYVGNQISERKGFALPLFIAVQQSVDICTQIYNEKQPIRVVFYNSDGEMLEYKNPAFIKFEGGN